MTQLNNRRFGLVGAVAIATFVLCTTWELGQIRSTPAGPESPAASYAVASLDSLFPEPLVAPLAIGAYDSTVDDGSQNESSEASSSIDMAMRLLRHRTDRFEHDERAAFHPHGESVCASGCATSRHPTPKLTPSRYRQLVTRYASPIKSIRAAALDELLFHGPQTADCLSQYGTFTLDNALANRLRGELRLTHARIAVRVTDANGRTRAVLEPTSVPLDRRHVFDLQTDEIQPMVASGTAKRVGSDRVWTRL